MITGSQNVRTVALMFIVLIYLMFGAAVFNACKCRWASEFFLWLSSSSGSERRGENASCSSAENRAHSLQKRNDSERTDFQQFSHGHFRTSTRSTGYGQTMDIPWCLLFLHPCHHADRFVLPLFPTSSLPHLFRIWPYGAEDTSASVFPLNAFVLFSSFSFRRGRTSFLHGL